MTDDIGVIPAPEHRTPCAPIGVHEIGTVTNLDGTKVTVGVNVNLVTVDGPLEVEPGEYIKLMGVLATAGLEAARNARSMAKADGDTL